MEKQVERVYLLLGTNQGNKARNLSTAISLLVTEMAPYLFSEIFESSVLESEPWGFESQESFLNQAIAFDTSLSAEQVLQVCQYVEDRLGRNRNLPLYNDAGERIYHDRVIDIDILLYGTQHINLPHLVVPHPRLHEREFALKPLRELISQATLDEILAE